MLLPPTRSILGQLFRYSKLQLGFPGDIVVKNPTVSAEAAGDAGTILVRKIPWRRKWQPTPVFLPGKSHGQRSLVGLSSWGHKELGTIEHTVHMQSLTFLLMNKVVKIKVRILT